MYVRVMRLCVCTRAQFAGSLLFMGNAYASAYADERTNTSCWYRPSTTMNCLPEFVADFVQPSWRTDERYNTRLCCETFKSHKVQNATGCDRMPWRARNIFSISYAQDRGVLVRPDHRSEGCVQPIRGQKCRCRCACLLLFNSLQCVIFLRQAPDR